MDFKQSRIPKLLGPAIRLHPMNTLPQKQEVFALPWNAALDCYVIENKLKQKIQITGNVTQRVLLKFVASSFDPLGFIAPLTVRLSKVLQAICNHDPKWDKPLLLDNIQNFSRLSEEFRAFMDVEIPRIYFLNKIVISLSFILLLPLPNTLYLPSPACELITRIDRSSLKLLWARLV